MTVKKLILSNLVAARAVAIQSKDTSCYEALAGALEAAHNFNVLFLLI